MKEMEALISWVGEYNDHVTAFLNEVNRNVKRVYFLYTDSEGYSTRKGEKVGYKKITNKFIAIKMKQYPSIKFKKIAINDARDFNEIVKTIGEIVNSERRKNNDTRMGIAVNFTGGTTLTSAAMLHAAHELNRSAYYVRLDIGRKGAEKIVPIALSRDAGMEITNKQKLWLKLIAENEHNCDPRNIISDNGFLEKGVATRPDMENKVKEHFESLREYRGISVPESKYRVSEDILKELKNKRMIEKINCYCEWIEDKNGEAVEKEINRPMYKLTDPGNLVYLSLGLKEKKLKHWLK